MIKILSYSEKEIFARPDVLRRLRFLTNGGWARHEIGSAMFLDLGEKRPGHYFLAWENGVIVGWATLCSRIYENSYQFQCYTARPHRRRGIGKRLLNRARKLASEKGIAVVVIPWNDVGNKFYANFSDVDYGHGWIPFHRRSEIVY